MSPSRDDRDVTPSFDDRTADALLGGRAVESEPELTSFVTDLTALAEEPPTPSAALAELLEHGLVGVTAPVAAPPAVRRKGFATPLWLRGALVGALAVTGMLSAAAANVLPGPAQDAVATVVSWVTPVELPRGHDPVPVPSPSVTPRPEPSQDAVHGTVEPGGDTRHGGTPSPGSTSASHDDGSGTSDGGSGGSRSGGSDDGISGGSDDSSPSPTTTPTSSSGESPEPSASPTPSDGGGSGSGDH